MQYVLYGIIVIALVILVRNIRIVPQAQAAIVERLGSSSPASAPTRPHGASACT